MNLCKHCKEPTTNPSFCSKSCSASFNNKLNPKRKLTRVCLDCDLPVKSYRHYRCDQHLKEYKQARKDSFKMVQVGVYRSKLSVAGKHQSWLNSHVRHFARAWLKHLTVEPCRHCGYTKHVELAHIKAVSDYPDDTLLGVINDETNVIPLCPNCHWEFDNLPRDKISNLQTDA